VEKTNNEQIYYDALKRIAKAYMTTEQLQRRAEKMYGVSYHEALEMTYDNIQQEAIDAIRGKRRPKDAAKPALQSSEPLGKTEIRTEVVP
jgi:hypothetical protein